MANDATASLQIVDDERDIAQALKLGLERQGFRADATNSPLEALEQFKNKQYDMSILDVRMPEMDGFTLYQKMCEIRKTGGIKMCFLTAFDRECHQEFKNRFTHLHERCFMHKPVKLQELVAVITAELKPQAANRPNVSDIGHSLKSNVDQKRNFAGQKLCKYVL